MFRHAFQCLLAFKGCGANRVQNYEVTDLFREKSCDAIVFALLDCCLADQYRVFRKRGKRFGIAAVLENNAPRGIPLYSV
jgi:hypothetical protein